MSKGNEAEGASKPRPRRMPDLNQIHHSPIFWVGVVLFVAAVGIYLLFVGQWVRF